MYMDEIQYTYKSCKLYLMKSIHENDIYILDIFKTQNYIHDKKKHELKTCFYEFCVN